jgi:hypothetical protein
MLSMKEAIVKSVGVIGDGARLSRGLGAGLNSRVGYLHLPTAALERVMNERAAACGSDPNQRAALKRASFVVALDDTLEHATRGGPPS